MDEARSLLLVDDEEGIRRVLALTLADMGWRVRAAASGEEALALFRQEPADIVVTDVKMPGMDGLALLQAVKALDPECEVVLITGHGDMDLAIQGIKLDAADFIAKPLRDDALSIALSRAWERRAMRRALRLHAENLERLVEEKTRELLASERLAAVGQTVAGLSHAVKNMASGLEGSLFLLRQGLEADRKAWRDQGWEMLEANVRTLKSLSLDMLRIARPEALRPAPTDPALPARQVAELLAPRFQEQGVDLVLRAAPGMAPAMLDAEALHRCLLNLVGNALDACLAAGYGPAGTDGSSGGRLVGRPGGRVELSVEREPDGAVRYDVSDNGCGIADEDRERLFTAFFSTKGDGGSGLGLVASKKTVEAHGGTLVVESLAGAGSCFRIIIPEKTHH
ncbi:Histidine kinase-, DNA gyrase B-, and HSP90-like ATPase [Humidesulfovibrio mexicanus]|uniref:histidine kinase n=1 Tax=Humidesulfovibrio mexicanus TaxID=147047 RepID=A0A239C1R0_9BACT|nr:response regulator [Humidesulfovibrio mexicanus]SNS13832.1 Histidine kinase-, DNA gyrase B-, and HSP90-like ATPase [Humidesulfovibrio mexicanus]